MSALANRDQIISAIRSGNSAIAHELMAQSHFSLCDRIDSISEKVYMSASRRDVDRALAIFSSLVVSSLAFFTTFRR
jgi:hypothetical protein